MGPCHCSHPLLTPCLRRFSNISSDIGLDNQPIPAAKQSEHFHHCTRNYWNRLQLLWPQANGHCDGNHCWASSLLLGT